MTELQDLLDSIQVSSWRWERQPYYAVDLPEVERWRRGEPSPPKKILYREGKSVELLMTEFALHHPIAPAPVMLAQVDRLLALQGLPFLTRFGIIPLGQQIPAAVAHNFVIRDSTVTVELINTEVSTRDPDDLRRYDAYLERLWAQAAEDEATRSILRRRAEALARSQ